MYYYELMVNVFVCIDMLVWFVYRIEFFILFFRYFVNMCFKSFGVSDYFLDEV